MESGRRHSGASPGGQDNFGQGLGCRPSKSRLFGLRHCASHGAIGQPIFVFKANRDRLVVLDEIQNQPELLNELRGEIDADRRPGRFLLLGSASFKLLKQSQSLAGRLSLVDMSPLVLSEVFQKFEDTQTLWLRGGFPNSYQAKTSEASWDWRQALIRHFLNSDLPALGINVSPPLMHRFGAWSPICMVRCLTHPRLRRPWVFQPHPRAVT